LEMFYVYPKGSQTTIRFFLALEISWGGTLVYAFMFMLLCMNFSEK
jgi:hypothetical protein